MSFDAQTISPIPTPVTWNRARRSAVLQRHTSVLFFVFHGVGVHIPTASDPCSVHAYRADNSFVRTRSSSCRTISRLPGGITFRSDRSTWPFDISLFFVYVTRLLKGRHSRHRRKSAPLPDWNHLQPLHRNPDLPKGTGILLYSIQITYITNKNLFNKSIILYI